MDTDSPVKMLMLFRQSFYLRKVFQTDRDAQGVTDLVCSHVAQDFILTVFQVTKMNMAMGIDIHGANEIFKRIEGRYCTEFEPYLLADGENIFL